MGLNTAHVKYKQIGYLPESSLKQRKAKSMTFIIIAVKSMYVEHKKSPLSFYIRTKVLRGRSLIIVWWI